MARKPKNPPHIFGKLAIPPKAKVVDGGLVKSGKGNPHQGAWPEDPDDSPEVEPEYRKESK